MSDNTMTLTVEDILATARGTDPDGSPTQRRQPVH